jgi:hypothetical protein
LNTALISTRPILGPLTGTGQLQNAYRVEGMKAILVILNAPAAVQAANMANSVI